MATTNNKPWPISSKSRTKLNAVRYNDERTLPEIAIPKDRTGNGHNDKENQSSWLNGVVVQAQASKEEAHDALPPAMPLIEQPALTEEPRLIKDCPQTPGNRIPLEDLISNAEDAFESVQASDVTPVDHVIWQHVPASSNPDASSQTPARRRRKRRHGSSPVGSPSRENSKKPHKEPLDLQSIQALLKTPQHDLAAELWNNYVDKNMVEGTEDLPAPRLANLLSSSPQTPVSGRTSRDSSGLRRSISCVAEWPSSRTKRRKVNRQDLDSGRSIFSRTRSNVLDSGKGKSSRINFLLDRIEKSLHPPSQSEMGPPNSSPLRQRMDAQRCRSSSPILDRQGTEGAKAINDGQILELAEHATALACQGLQDSDSEFGGDDLDEDFLNLAENAADPFVDTSRQERESTPFGSFSGMKQTAGTPAFGDSGDAALRLTSQRHSTTNENGRDDSDNFDDDFGDDDFGIFDDQLQDALVDCEMEPVKVSNTHVATGIQSIRQVEPTSSNHDSQPPAEGLHVLGQAAQSSSDDEFDDDFDLDAIEQTMGASGNSSTHNNIKSREAIKRYQVVDTAQGSYVNSKGRTQPEQVLSVKDERTDARKVIILRESWFDTPCVKDSFVHLVGDFNALGQCVIDNSHNMIILHPDHLISATVVADSVDCQRRAVLQDRVKVIGQIERPQAFGIIFHEVFQAALMANQWDSDSMRLLVEKVLENHIEELYTINMRMSDAIDEVMSKLPQIQGWADVFLQTSPKANSLVEDRNGAKLNLSINKLLEVEEHVWSPMYGLKGNIDATVQVACVENDTTKTLVVPLELKTGKRDTNQAHRAQTALYTLLLSDRYDVDVTFGLLYYLELSKTLSIRGIRHELVQMVQVRNRLACYVRERTQLPPMLKKAQMCNKCYAKTPCLIYHKLAEDGNGDSSALSDDFEAFTRHLNEGDRDFFRKWDDLLTKEESNLIKFKRELWTLLSDERESLGRCFGDVVLDSRTVFEDQNGSRINRFRYTFRKRSTSPSFSFLESQIAVGDPIVVSDEKGHFALANGYITHVHSSHITVAVDRRLHEARAKTVGFDPVSNQSFRGIMEVGKDGLSELANPEEQMTYRIDKDEFSNGMAIVRNNLICMMDKDLYQSRHLRRLIIAGQPPIFQSTSPSYNIPDSASLNVDQKQAIEKVMRAKDYALVLGMPGTGKTTTIAHIIRTLVAQGKSVLLTSYTHTAVDNILLKIRNDNIPVLRIGAATKIHPEVQEFADMAAIPKKTVEELKHSYENPPVVATTCLGVNHNIFNQRIFDYCIVDEASQITLPVCLGPIRMARTFILVGDHYQLPPLVQNKAAQEGGLDVSLFKLLSDAQPDSVVNLEHQYRMCEDIMLLSNVLIYSGRLKCGTAEVAGRSLEIPNIHALAQFHTDNLVSTQAKQEICLGKGHGRCWLNDLLAPSAKTLLVNTDTLGAASLETAQGQRVVNHVEAVLCTQLVEALIACGISARDIGVITFYRSQLSLLRQSLRHYAPELEMHTTDKFQGRDKEIIILSCVRSNSENHVGELLRDWRRVNVAFTRARTKLLVLGSKSTLRDGNELLGKYVKLVEGEGWIYDLPFSAVESHTFSTPAFDSTQMPLASPRTTRSPTSSKKGPESSMKKKPETRDVLSPSRSRNLKQPAKRGAKLFNGTSVVGNRPILQDIVNDIAG
ncbi:Uncharacterized protein PECH_000665 [Penicillium ucsense]|uniref:DNA replication ATP-dependent helicase/nuclease n=1 Tax=Penicillium ucsense TaxID=2839758 RepID=A0A8J8W2T9_9EURO|nr:Uncharacterized protein PECM_004984 [Penicillium ucsense]KAF7738391.1 Uncharacterized protein PECH_000665 [Penicillium ucsense]